MTNDTQNIIHHWREAVPDDRMAHLIRDASRAFRRALQIRLARHGVPFGHWRFLRILWDTDGLTQKELSARAGVMEPTTFSAMKAMESLGYIERRQIATNKKVGRVKKRKASDFVPKTTFATLFTNPMLPGAASIFLRIFAPPCIHSVSKMRAVVK